MWAAVILAALLILNARGLAGYFRESRADWRPLARFLVSRPAEERVFTENQYSQLCVAFYAVGPTWLADRARHGRDIANLDGEIVRLTWSWTPGTTAWLVLAGEPQHEQLRAWARIFPSQPFPTAEGAVLVRLDPSLRDAAFATPR